MPAAEVLLVRRYTPRIASFVRPIIWQSSDVDDVVQLVFIKALRRLGVLREAAAFESWLFCLARNTALDFIRRRRCRPVTVPIDCEIPVWPDAHSFRGEAEILEARDHDRAGRKLSCHGRVRRADRRRRKTPAQSLAALSADECRPRHWRIARAATDPGPPATLPPGGLAVEFQMPLIPLVRVRHSEPAKSTHHSY